MPTSLPQVRAVSWRTDRSAGEFAWQERTLAAVRKVNGCAATGGLRDKQSMICPSNGGSPLVTCIFAGGHQFNPAAPALIVKFFKEHPGGMVESAGATYLNPSLTTLDLK